MVKTMALRQSFLKLANVYDKAYKMPLSNYMQFLRTNDLLWFTNFFDVKRRAPKKEVLQDAADSIASEIIKRTKNSFVISRYEKAHKIWKHQTIYSTVNGLISYIKQYHSLLTPEMIREVITEIENCGFIYNNEGELFSQLDEFSEQSKALLTEINVLQEEDKKSRIEQSFSMEKELTNISRYLELGYSIDPHKHTVENYIVWLELCNEKQEAEQREKMKKK